MIILMTVKKDCTWYLHLGDTFNLTIVTQLEKFMLEDRVIVETITVTKTINFVASFVFAQEDGHVPFFNLCGFFGDKDYLPKEIREATYKEDLTDAQYSQLMASVGLKGDLRA